MFPHPNTKDRRLFLQLTGEARASCQARGQLPVEFAGPAIRWGCPSSLPARFHFPSWHFLRQLKAKLMRQPRPKHHILVFHVQFPTVFAISCPGWPVQCQDIADSLDPAAKPGISGASSTQKAPDNMFIRATKTRSTADGKPVHRLVLSQRIGDKVRQRTLPRYRLSGGAQELEGGCRRSAGRPPLFEAACRPQPRTSSTGARRFRADAPEEDARKLRPSTSTASRTRVRSAACASRRFTTSASRVR